MSNGAVTGSLSSVINITMSGNIAMSVNSIISSGGNNILQYDGSQTVLNYGYRSTKPSWVCGSTINFRVGDSTIVIVNSSGLRIGDGLITWDSMNNALKFQKYDGTACHIYSTGGVTALTN